MRFGPPFEVFYGSNKKGWACEKDINGKIKGDRRILSPFKRFNLKDLRFLC